MDKAHQKANWRDELANEMLAYAAKDASVLLPLAEVLVAKAEEARLGRVLRIEQWALPSMVWMATTGLPFDAAGWRDHLKRRTGVTRFTEWVNAPVQGTGADGLKFALALL